MDLPLTPGNRRRRDRDVARAAALLLRTPRTDLEHRELARLVADDDVRRAAKQAAVTLAAKNARPPAPWEREA